MSWRWRMKTGLAAGPLAEPIMAFAMLLVGIALAMPGDTFSRSSFATLADIASEETWSVVMISLGSWHILTAILESKYQRMVGCVLSAIVWLAWTISTLISGLSGVLWCFGIAFTIGHSIAYLRTSVKK